MDSNQYNMATDLMCVLLVNAIQGCHVRTIPASFYLYTIYAHSSFIEIVALQLQVIVG